MNNKSKLIVCNFYPFGSRMLKKIVAGIGIMIKVSKNLPQFPFPPWNQNYSPGEGQS